VLASIMPVEVRIIIIEYNWVTFVWFWWKQQLFGQIQS